MCVFCGSQTGSNPIYARSAVELARAVVAKDMGIVYGGGSIGLMGVLADAMLAQNGTIIGVIPQALADREVAHSGLTQLHLVTSMHERKAMMSDLSDAFIALPGGYGTLDELCEAITWFQLGIHDKPVGLLNVDGYFDALLAMFDHAENEGFISPENRRILRSATTLPALFTAMEL
ncbi:MAG: TIGR00730 family Rossman fold protein [Candidatus Eremiobacteraeota bacterium]|nr:TIGR00730 family Rossman fold protein [Candidatus Eremiobacteraeota bacterium]